MFVVSYACLAFNIHYFGIEPFYYGLVCAMLAGLQLIVAFDWYNDGVKNRSFGLFTLYFIGLIIGAVIFYLLICNLPLNIFSQLASILKIEAVR